RIDMTPMVDLGFLLISFFIFTTEITRPVVTNLYMTHDGSPNPIPASKTLTILLDDEKVFYYSGNMNDAIDNNKVLQTSFSETTGLGNVIREKQSELEKRKINRKELTVVIKPGSHSLYKDLINALDEMLINGVSRYMIVDVEEGEKSYMDH